MRPVLLLAALALAAPARAQTDHEVSFESASGVTLAGTVSVPAGEGPFPAVVLVSGSGVQDRDGGPDSPVFPAGFRIYRDLAEALRQRGILVLRYDERGAGASTAGPDPQSVTTRDYAVDAGAAVRLLAERPDVRWVGVVGHSEGGTVAPLVAGAEPAVDGVVMVAGPGVPGLATSLEQNRMLLTGAGVRPSAVDSFVVAADSAFAPLAASAGGELDDATRDLVRDRLTAAFNGLPADQAAKIGLTPAVVPMAVAQQMQAVSSPWFRTYLALDPAEPIAALAVPALALFFELDTQVPPALNVEPVRQALSASASPDWEVTTLDGVNHPMQAAETGAPAEYRTLAPAVDPSVPATIADWVLKTADD